MKAWTIKGRTALVTGANRGIGYALVEALLRRGVSKVYAGARDPKTLEGLDVPRLTPVRLDVTDPEQLRELPTLVPDVQLVINNAGASLSSDIFAADALNLARREMEVNYLGALAVIRSLAPVLGRNGGGVILNVCSAAGLTGLPFMPTYSASKAAMHSLTQSARLLLARQSTSVLGCYAGPVDTDMTRGLPFQKASPRDVANAILDGVEAGQEDIFPDAFAVEFARRYQASPKDSERQVRDMVSSPAA